MTPNSPRLERFRPALYGVVMAVSLCTSSALLVVRLDPRVDYSEPGEALIHASAGYRPVHLPLSEVAAALALTHRGGLAGSASLRAVAFLVAAALTSAAAGTLSPLLFSVSWSGNGEDVVQLLYSLLVALCGLALMWRARRPSWRRSLVLGTAFGATLLYRSPLAFFPPLLALYEFAAVYRRSWRRYWDHFLALAVAPYLFLAPWILLNWRWSRRFVPFENGEADCNIVTGALGLVHTVEGPWRSLAGLPESARGGAVLAWAVGRVCAHPFVYLAGYAARLAFVFTLHPFLIAIAGLAFWSQRRAEEYRQLGLLAAYFVAIHCAMSIESQYLAPLWPLLSVAAAALIDRGFARGRSGPAFPRASGAVLAAGLALALGAALYTESLLVSRLRASTDVVPTGATDAWLLSDRAWRRHDAGDLRGAEENVSAALALRPQDEQLRLWLAWLQMLRGRPRSLALWKTVGPPDTPTIEIVAHLLKAEAALRARRPADARSELEASLQSTRGMIVTRGETGPGAQAGEVLQSAAGVMFLEQASRALTRMPLVDADALLAALSRLHPAWEELSRERFALSIALLDAGKYRPVAELIDSLPAPQRDPRLVAACALAAFRAGDAARALDLLGKAAALHPDAPTLLTMIGLYLDAGVYAPTTGLLRALPAAQSPEPLVDLAHKAMKPGGRAATLALLAKAEQLHPDAENLLDIVFVYQDLRLYDRERRLLASLLKERPADAALAADLGVCDYLAGRKADAVRELEAALRLDPRRLPAYLSLGAIAEGDKRYAEALRIYESARPYEAGGDPAQASALDESRRKVSALVPADANR